jgi:hypothetical protein
MFALDSVELTVDANSIFSISHRCHSKQGLQNLNASCLNRRQLVLKLLITMKLAALFMPPVESRSLQF